MEISWRLSRHLTEQFKAQWPAGIKCALVGVSGGADSICLLHLLLPVSAKLGFKVCVVHVNHGIRGEESEADQEFVKALCDKFALPCHVKAIDAREYAKENGYSLEDAARRLRRGIFKEAMKHFEADAVVLAHHRDDQAETVLLNLLRGAASDGLCGMHLFRDGIFRPLLEVPSKDIKACLLENGWSWREDASNQDQDFKRNALRHRWIPLIREHTGQDPTGPLVRFAAIEKEEQEFLDSLAKSKAVECNLEPVSSEVEASRFLVKELSRQHISMARRIVFLAWEMATGSRAGLESVHANAVVRLCAVKRGGSSVSLPFGMTAIILRNWCCIKKRSDSR